MPVSLSFSPLLFYRFFISFTLRENHQFTTHLLHSFRSKNLNGSEIKRLKSRPNPLPQTVLYLVITVLITTRLIPRFLMVPRIRGRGFPYLQNAHERWNIFISGRFNTSYQGDFSMLFGKIGIFSSWIQSYE